ncbi:hypothetical protein AAZX31_03G241100 [Glycine max]
MPIIIVEIQYICSRDFEASGKIKATPNHTFLTDDKLKICSSSFHQCDLGIFSQAGNKSM